jgi:putative hydrolase of HD superfamily
MKKRTKPDIHRLLEFQRILLEFQAIQRKVNIPPTLDDTENDVEHSYGLAMVGWYLASFFPELDTDRIIRLGLAHDLVEIHAGDTYSYSDSATLGRKERLEKLAFQRLQEQWQDFPEMLDAIHEYKTKQTAEAKFVYALDKLLPAMIDYMNEGRGWRHLGITAKMFRVEKDRKVPISPEVNEYMDQLHALLADQLHLFAPEQVK